MIPGAISLRLSFSTGVLGANDNDIKSNSYFHV